MGYEVISPDLPKWGLKQNEIDERERSKFEEAH